MLSIPIIAMLIPINVDALIPNINAPIPIIATPILIVAMPTPNIKILLSPPNICCNTTDKLLKFYFIKLRLRT